MSYYWIPVEITAGWNNRRSIDRSSGPARATATLRPAPPRAGPLLLSIERRLFQPAVISTVHRIIYGVGDFPVMHVNVKLSEM